MTLRLIHLNSLDELRAAAGAWDDLWRRSDVAVPTARAELVAQWVEQFAPGARFRAVAVEDQGQWVAALPLVGRRIKRIIAAGTMPSNQWSASGELLLDPTADPEPVSSALVAGMRQLPWPVLWLDDTAVHSRRWQSLLAALDHAGVPWRWRMQMEIGRLEIDHDWAAYQGRWSRKHRQQMARHARRLAEHGDVRFQLFSDLRADEVADRLLRGFEVEDRGWKGEAGTSVLRTPGMLEFFQRQARQLAAWGHLDLAWLECGADVVAFAYGFSGKGVYFSYKVGYDPRYAAYGPGQLLRHFLLERLFSDPRRLAVDYMPPSEAHLKWRPALYPVGRLVVALRGVLGRMLVRAIPDLFAENNTKSHQTFATLPHPAVREAD